VAKSLVLNVTDEPLSVVLSRRALVLVLDERAETVHATGRIFRSEHLEFDEPSVVRLCKYVHVPRAHRRGFSRRGVLHRDGHRCQYCGSRAESVDHVVPRSRGGQHTWENVVAACRRCNTVKRDRLLEETGLRLRNEPRVPRLSTWFAVMAGSIPSVWEPYLELAAGRTA
jgi:5-methylcytosine-specific restriction endonuclease McrA